MNEHLQNILDLIQQAQHLSDEERDAFIKEAKATDKDFAITAFKLQRAEKVKHTTAVLLEESMEELEQKRKAVEAQNNELEIEAALEKVRSRSLAMHKSDELADAATLLLRQIRDLGIKTWGAGFNIWQPDGLSVTAFMSNPDGSIQPPFTLPHNEYSYFKKISEARQRGELFFVLESGGEELEEMRRYMLKLPVVKGIVGDMETSGDQWPTFQVNHCAFFSQGYLLFVTYEPVPESWGIFKRFAKVFEQTYTRFLDLQKAEVQAREARIELSLERVRARAMAMRNSEELNALIGTVFGELTKLDLVLTRCVIIIYDPKTNDARWWMANSEVPLEPMNFLVKYAEHPPHLAYLKAWHQRTLKWEYILDGAIKREWDDFLFSETELSQLPDFVIAGMKAPDKVYLNASFNSFGNLTLASLEPLPEEHFGIMLRFAKVFDLTYTRFSDLKQAEAQARESQIQLAMERVRATTMAMQQSNELPDAALVLSNQVKELGVQLWGTSFQLWTEDRKQITVWSCIRDIMIPPFKVPVTADPLYKHIFEAGQKGEALYLEELHGNALEDHMMNMMSIPAFREGIASVYEQGFILPTSLVFHAAYFSNGFILFISPVPCPEAHNIFTRFGKVFEQTYTRFLDLQRAEAQTLEAIKRASVDRVRAEIASMRTTSDLERITPLIWNELTTLGVPFIRCGVFIMDEQTQQIETHLSTPDGKAIAIFNLPFNAPGVTALIVAHWYKKELYKQHWDEAQFIEFTQSLVQQGVLTAGEKYLTENRPMDLYLHFLPFLQGMLYAGNIAPLSHDELRLMQELANAFSTAYARYEDFNKLEAAKKQVDSTLNELQATQKQLIQAEKMASLGELTAGIAHEIQNPLNFVNNFSEVNSELLEELKEAIKKGNYEEVKMIAGDIAGNEAKISHHGKRADSIVKGMLQHSRSTTTVKEPTNINSLADEYFRLAYHGLRARDKSFNAAMKTDFDETISKIDVIPQDIGRVILNVITNAFYTVNEKKKKLNGGYEPLVLLSTRKIQEGIEIMIADNGIGIPQKVIDKIFQPFFTTKPTGQGTGLGLSMAYDIVKAHGGEIKVKTIEGEGCEFMIQLPAF